MQGVEVLVQRPAGLGAEADGVRLVLQKVSTGHHRGRLRRPPLGPAQGERRRDRCRTGRGRARGGGVDAHDHDHRRGGRAGGAADEPRRRRRPPASPQLLASTYLTAVQVNAALSALQATLSASIAGVSSNLATNYYVKAQVDSGIASAVGAASTALNGRIDTAEAAIEDEAGFRVAGDSALAGRVATIEARQRPRLDRLERQLRHRQLRRVERRVPRELHRGPARRLELGAADLLRRPTCSRSPPTRARPARSTTRRREAKQGDIVSASALYAAGGTTRDVTLRFIVRFLDAAGAILSSPFTEVLNTTGTAWARVQTPGYPAPANTASVLLYVQRVAGGSGDAYVTGIEGRKGDGAALARISTVEAVAASASGAITSLATSINASFGSQSAFISEMQGAVATLDSATAFWGFRQKAGAAVGTAEAVAFTDATARRSPPSRSTTTSSTSRAGSAPATW